MTKNLSEDHSLATIVSIYPRKLVEYKPGLFPSEFIIPYGTFDIPGLSIIGDNVHYLVNPDPLSDTRDVAQIKVPVRAFDCAQSVIMDWVNALINVEPGQQPGIFPVKGGFDEPSLIKIRFMKEMEQYRMYQTKWFESLVLSADEQYAHTRSPAGISDMQREACKALGLKREWLIEARIEVGMKCPFCANPINPGAIFCSFCSHVLDKKKYEELNPTRMQHGVASK